MPIYTFESKDGDFIEKLVPIGTKRIVEGGKNYTRSTAPEGFAFTGSAVGIPSQADQVKDGYYKLEQEKGSRFLERSQFTTKQIKKAWGF